MIDYEKLNDKKYTPKKLYNRIVILDSYLPELQYLTEKIMMKSELYLDNLSEIHEELYIASIKLNYILEHCKSAMRARK